MVPSEFIQLEKIPLTPSGKLDRDSLLRQGLTVNKEYIAPKSRLEQTLAGIWAEVLDREPGEISREANFFDLGGHSLRATILINKIHQKLEVKVPLAEIFKAPTLRALAQFINASESAAYKPLNPVEKKEYYPLASTQKRLYLLQKMEPGSLAYNTTYIQGLKGELLVPKFQEAWLKLIARNESLRTSFEFIAKEEEPVQRIHRPVNFTLQYLEFPAEDRLKHEVRNFDRPFDLSRVPLIRVKLIKMSDRQYLFMAVIHHLVTDLSSMAVILHAVRALYSGQELAPLRLQYRDFCQWQTRMLTSGNFERQRKYWLKQFPGELPVLNMPTDYQRSPEQGYEGDNLSFTFDTPLTRKLKHLMRETDTTLFMLALAIYNILLSKLSGQDDIIIGTAVAGRNHADLENMVGLLIETLALRNQPKEDKSFEAFLKDIRLNTLDAFENREYPFRELLRELNPVTPPGRNPLFDVLLLGQNVDYEKFTGTGAREFEFTPYEADSPKAAMIDITLQAGETAKEIHFSLQYSTSLFKGDTMAAFIRSFRDITGTVAENPKIKIKDIPLSYQLDTAAADLYEEERSEAWL